MTMHPTLRLAAVIAALGAGSPALAQQPKAPGAAAPAGAEMQLAQRTYADVIVGLENSGYEVVEMTTTFLGRARIVARSPEHLREVVVSRSTGAIKSDVILESYTEAEASGGVAVSTDGTGAGAGGSGGLSGLLGGILSGPPEEDGAAALGGTLQGSGAAGGTAGGALGAGLGGALDGVAGGSGGSLGAAAGGAAGAGIGGSAGGADLGGGADIGGGGGVGVGL